MIHSRHRGCARSRFGPRSVVPRLDQIGSAIQPAARRGSKPSPARAGQCLSRRQSAAPIKKPLAVLNDPESASQIYITYTSKNLYAKINRYLQERFQFFRTTKN